MIEEIVQSEPSTNIHCLPDTRKGFKDLTGTRCHSLLVIGYSGTKPRRDGKGTRSWWRVRCDCGKEKDVESCNFKSGDLKSCGCKRGENIATSNKRHGMESSEEYQAWCSMIQRCGNQSNKSYARYGGRGISVFRGWVGPGGFDEFISHVGRKPTSSHSIGRINNDGNYEPGNVRWETHDQQSSNKATSRKIEYSGKVQTISQWSKMTGIGANTISKRIILGWDVKRALTIPVRVSLKRNIIREKRKPHL